MLSFSYLIVLANLLVGLNCHELSEECKSYFSQNNPNKCCILPFPILTKDQNDAYAKAIESHRDDKCFGKMSSYDISGLYTDGQYHKDRMVDLLKNYFDEKYPEDVEGNAKWMAVIEKSVDACGSLTSRKHLFDFQNISFHSDLDFTDQTDECGLPLYFTAIFFCQDQLNFLGCPLFKEDDQCDGIKKFVQENRKYGYQVGEFYLLDHVFWRPKGKKETDEETNASAAPDQ